MAEIKKDYSRDYNIKKKGTDKISIVAPNVQNAQPLTPDRWNEIDLVETLGRYDNLADLKIPPEQYSSDGNSEGYGIHFVPAVHGNANNVRIRDNQQLAAKTFLHKLRGFGLLADCVGSGKTYEACVVISELAVRGLIDNLLIIVPDEALLTKWTRVVEMSFGLGRGNLQRIDSLGEIRIKKRVGDCEKPKGAYIMVYKAFVGSGESYVRNMLFDMIVVDEAHNLCGVSEGDMRSMYYLSLMMLTKRRKEFDKPYCLLLTATPHSGNLEQMFNLWYFIRFKGGIPECFRKGGQPTAEDRLEFDKEREYYRDVVCKGAATVAEYIDRAQCELLVGVENVENATRTDFFRSFEATTYSFGKVTERVYPAITFADWKAMKNYERKSRANAYLSLARNAGLKLKNESEINHLYVEEVMRPIMVRHKNDLAVARRAHSYFFLPIGGKAKAQAPARKPLAAHFFFDDVPFDKDAFDKLFKEESGSPRRKLFDHNPHFRDNGGVCESGFAEYYKGALSRLLEGTHQDDFVHVEQTECSLENEEQKLFEAKCARFVQIIRMLDKERGDNHRTIVFFDYTAEQNDGVEEASTSWYRLSQYLEDNAKDLFRRVVHGTGDDAAINAEIDAYNKNADAILLAEDSKYTEGQDLQSGNVVFNFEVPVDPMSMDQRIGRVHRLGQSDDVQIYSFATMSRLDGYCLAYFAAVGILSDRNGDATILSGCNSDKMRALRCPECKEVELIYESDYEELLPECPACKKKGVHSTMDPHGFSDKNGVGTEAAFFVCKAHPLDAAHRIPMEYKHALRCNCQESHPVKRLIVFNEFICEKDSHHRVKRVKSRDNDYVCMAASQVKLKRIDRQNGDIVVSCSKQCALQHCKGGDPKCMLRANLGTIMTANQAAHYCVTCRQYDTCKCRIDRPIAESCAICNEEGRKGLTCGMTPYEINFGPEYRDGKCPICGGKLNQVNSNTFKTFILERYGNDKDFCKNFSKELEKTLEIKKIITFND